MASCSGTGRQDTDIFRRIELLLKKEKRREQSRLAQLTSAFLKSESSHCEAPSWGLNSIEAGREDRDRRARVHFWKHAFPLLHRVQFYSASKNWVL